MERSFSKETVAGVFPGKIGTFRKKLSVNHNMTTSFCQPSSYLQIDKMEENNPLDAIEDPEELKVLDFKSNHLRREVTKRNSEAFVIDIDTHQDNNESYENTAFQLADTVDKSCKMKENKCHGSHICEKCGSICNGMYIYV